MYFTYNKGSIKPFALLPAREKGKRTGRFFSREAHSKDLAFEKQ